MMALVADRLHENEIRIDESLARSLLEEQAPQWADLRLDRVSAPGSDHVLFRLGDKLVVRLPRKEGVDAQVDKEREWLPRLAPRLPAAVPVPVAYGRPSAEYPFAWSVYRWIEGASPPEGDESPELAADLARFVGALRRIETDGGPPYGVQNFGRGCPLAERDAATRAAIEKLAGRVDRAAVVAAWEDALAAPAETAPVWVHGDLTPENILVRGGRLAAVVDFGCLGVGDGACDLMVAWSLLTGEARRVFRATLDADAASWRRGRGWALSTALVALPYYESTHLPRAANARYRIAEVLADLEGRA